MLSKKILLICATVVTLLILGKASFAQAGCGYFGTAPCPVQPQPPQPIYQPQQLQPQCHPVFIVNQGWVEVCN